ncbi:MAG: DnaJ domain-containing protein [Parcubacteria group bacterium]|nr:DnaJ domain-containing protein [Parcubacteria group bacterium]
MEDYYKILGVSRSASGEEIKKAYRKLAHQYHPDRPGGDEKKFKKVSEAYQILSNGEKRAQYDRFGTVFDNAAGGRTDGFWGTPQDGFGFEFDFGDLGGDNLNDLFDTFFEGLGIKRKRRTYEHGSDIEVAQEIILEEAHRGAKKELRYQTLVSCEHCKGIGHDASGGFDQCPACNGQGEIRENRNTFFGNFSRITACSRCHGEGRIPKKICAACSGKGKIAGERKVVIDIRPGIQNGQIIKFPKAGEAGERGAENGDLYVRIEIKPHPIFDRKGDDLYITKEVRLTDILLGKQITVPTLGGANIKISIPPDFSLREPLIIPKEGLAGHGNLYVILEVKTPAKIGARAKKLLEEIEKEI